MAAIATFALKAELWFRRGRFVMVAPRFLGNLLADLERLHHSAPLSRFPEPPLHWTRLSSVTAVPCQIACISSSLETSRLAWPTRKRRVAKLCGLSASASPPGRRRVSLARSATTPLMVKVGGGEALALRPQSFATLRFLVGHANRLVSKDELMQAIWQGTAVTDDSLVQCIHEIRRA
jgi:hypothetical protein